MFKHVALLLLLALPLPHVQALAAQTAEPADTAATAGLTLLPGDVVRVVIWREPDLSGDFPVDEDGIVVLPLIGEHSTTGVAVRELRRQLVETYRVHLRNPSISVTPMRRVNVLGEVNRPGLYPVDPTVSLAEAIALAGGANPLGDLNKIRVVRGEEVVLQRVGAGIRLQDADIRSGDQIVVQRRSWFDRNSTFLVSAMLSVASIVSTIIISRSR